MVKSRIFTLGEIKVMGKRIANKKLNQVDSNYLYKFIRPKLKEISSINAELLLNKMAYNKKIKSIEKRIREVILGRLKDVKAIILFGSAIQTNYTDYKDIDIMIVTKTKLIEYKKYKKINELKNIMKEIGIISDIEIISRDNLIGSYKNSPTLIYQLKDHKIIYGKIKVPHKIELYNADLHMKLDWSYVDDKKNGYEIYRAIRNTLLVRLLLNKIIDNSKLKDSLYYTLGRDLVDKLKSNSASEEDMKIALAYLNFLNKNTRKQIRGGLWERIKQ